MEDTRPPSPQPPLMFLGPIQSDKLARALTATHGRATCIFSITPLPQTEPLLRLPTLPAPLSDRFSATAAASDAIVQLVAANKHWEAVIIEDAYILTDLSRCVGLLAYHERQVVVVSEDRSIKLEMLPTIVAAMNHCIVYHCPPTCGICFTPNSAIVSSTLHSSSGPITPESAYIPLCYHCFRVERLRNETPILQQLPTTTATSSPSVRTRPGSIELNKNL